MPCSVRRSSNRRKSSETAPRDIGEVDDSQSLDWPGQRQVGEWDTNAIGNFCYTCGAAGYFAKDCPKGKGKGKGFDKGKGKDSRRYQEEEEAIEQVECQTCGGVSEYVAEGEDIAGKADAIEEEV